MFINAECNTDFIRKLAGRHPLRDRQAERYCAAEFQESLADPAKAIKGKSHERYRMVNLQNLRAAESKRLGFGITFDSGKYNTVELRIFRASLKKERLLAQIEFTHAAVMFCRVASYRDLNGNSFIKWLKGSAVGLYPHLSDWYGVRRREGAKNSAPAAQACTDTVPDPEPRPAPQATEGMQWISNHSNVTWRALVDDAQRMVTMDVPVTQRPEPAPMSLQERLTYALQQADSASRRGRQLERISWLDQAHQLQRTILRNSSTTTTI
jgi:hypothetical protein